MKKHRAKVPHMMTDGDMFICYLDITQLNVYKIIFTTTAYYIAVMK